MLEHSIKRLINNRGFEYVEKESEKEESQREIIEGDNMIFTLTVMKMPPKHQYKHYKSIGIQKYRAKKQKKQNVGPIVSYTKYVIIYS